MAARNQTIFLVDNGSLEPAAVLELRRVARSLAKKIGRRVTPVSILHSSGIPASKLDGRSAEILEPALRRRAKRGQRDFLVLPLFVGSSRALTDYIPERVAALRAKFSGLTVQVAPPLARAGHDGLARLVVDQVRAELTREFLRGEKARVAVVDHGSPARAVARARDQVAAQVRARLGREVKSVAACSMERRPGRAYAFNEPLLASLLARPAWRRSPVIVAQLFFLPGRHAGPRGDIAAICAAATRANPRQRIARTALLGKHAGLVDLLAEKCTAKT